MSDWAPRRFWKSATVSREHDGFTVRLDDRPLRTPAKTPLIVPSEALAQAIAAEWDAQVETIRPETMPFTRMANSALDKVTLQRAEVAAMLAEYGGTDLLCYRAETPHELTMRQAAAWDPLLDWAAQKFDARLEPCAGIMPIKQDAVALTNLAREVNAFDPFQLAGFHDLVAISGSLIIGLAAFYEARPISDLWDCSRIDELWQAELWGDDDEALHEAALKRQAFLDAARFCELLRS